MGHPPSRYLPTPAAGVEPRAGGYLPTPIPLLPFIPTPQTNEILPVSVTDPCSALGLASAPLPRVVPLTAASVLPLWAVHGPPERSASGGLPVIAQRLRTRRRRIHGRPSYWPWRSSNPCLLAPFRLPVCSCTTCALTCRLCANVPPVCLNAHHREQLAASTHEPGQCTRP